MFWQSCRRYWGYKIQTPKYFWSKLLFYYIILVTERKSKQLIYCIVETSSDMK